MQSNVKKDECYYEHSNLDHTVSRKEIFENQRRKQVDNTSDEYLQKTIKSDEHSNLDHTVSRKEIFEKQRRKLAKY